MSWTKEDLQNLVQSKFSDCKFIVVSNREPYVHDYRGNKLECSIAASGLTVALDPIMQACGGTWIAHGSGTADKVVVDKRNRVQVPIESPKYTLRRVWLTREEEDGYYSRFSNEALWPLCHIVYERPVFREADWEIYQKVNGIFADAVLDEIGDKKAFVFIQDYHLTLLAKLIKDRNPNIVTALFWHIPWPNPEVFRICPWKEDILEGLLANDLLGFHINYHRNNFLDTVERTLETKVDHENYAVHRGGKVTIVRPFPISIDFEQISKKAAEKEVDAEILELKQKYNLGNVIVGVGLDRIDYTKGIPERLKAIDILLSNFPEYKNKLVFFQLGEPSRMQVDRYAKLNVEVRVLAKKINRKYQTLRWKPIIMIKEHLSPATLLAFRRLANFFVVSSLHDGMNLVSKEFVAARNDEDGVLLLSQFTGASRELKDALLINPFAPDEMTQSIKKAIEMPSEIRRLFMQRMRKIVKENNIFLWAGNIINELSNC